MDNNQKFSLSDVTQEEQEAFMKDFTEFLNSRSLYFEPVPQYSRDDIKSPWKTTVSIFLQKKTPITEEPVIKDAEVQEGAVPSIDPEVNPAI